MKKQFKSGFTLFIVFYVMSSMAIAQVDLYQRSFLELKFGLGGTVFLGDLGGSRGKTRAGFLDLDVISLRQNASCGIKVNISNKLSFRGDVFRARLFGNDVLSGNKDRFNRNLSFRTDLTEVALTAEMVSFNFSSMGRNKTNTSEIYFFLGAGWIHFKPQALYRGQWYDLQPLGTEGQGIIPDHDFYKLNSVVVPFGFGYRKNLGRSTYLGFEFSLRKSFTDYLDDVSGRYYDREAIREHHGDVAAELSDKRIENRMYSEGYRGNPNQNDNYSFIQFTIAKGFGKKTANQKIELNLFKHTSGVKCPKF